MAFLQTPKQSISFLRTNILMMMEDNALSQYSALATNWKPAPLPLSAFYPRWVWKEASGKAQSAPSAPSKVPPGSGNVWYRCLAAHPGTCTFRD